VEWSPTGGGVAVSLDYERWDLESDVLYFSASTSMVRVPPGLAGSNQSDSDSWVNSGPSYFMFGPSIYQVMDSVPSPTHWDDVQNPWWDAFSRASANWEDHPMAHMIKDGPYEPGVEPYDLSFIVARAETDASSPRSGGSFVMSGTAGDERPPFDVDERSLLGKPAVRSTVIPSGIFSQILAARRLEYASDGTVTDAGKGSIVVDITFKDPCVVHLPYGYGWLMLVARIRKYEDANEEEPDKAWTVGYTPQNCFSDIVAFHAQEDDPAFQAVGRVRGPIWMVSDLRGARDDGSPEARTWLGVPGAIMLGHDLYVYYQCEAAEYFTMPEYDAEAAAEPDTWSRLDSGTGYYWSALGWPHFQPGIFAKRFSLLSIRTQFGNHDWILADGEKDDGSSSGYDMSTWEDQSNFWQRALVQGELLGPVRMWIGTGGSDAQPFTKWDGDAPAERFHRVTLADPCPVGFEDDEREDFALFFAAIGGHLTDRGGLPRFAMHGAYGLWRAISLPEGFVGFMGLPGVYGRDFLVAPLNADGATERLSGAFESATLTGAVSSSYVGWKYRDSWAGRVMRSGWEPISPDQVVASIIENRDPDSGSRESIEYTDPDVVRRSDGTYLVVAGCVYEPAKGGREHCTGGYGTWASTTDKSGTLPMPAWLAEAALVERDYIDTLAGS
jgi:hypothetical protein